jgi:hypothetical protein
MCQNRTRRLREGLTVVELIVLIASIGIIMALFLREVGDFTPVELLVLLAMTVTLISLLIPEAVMKGVVYVPRTIFFILGRHSRVGKVISRLAARPRVER